jgi:uncharacterized Zn finger protein
MSAIPPEFSHSIDLVLGYLVSSAPFINRGLLEGLGKESTKKILEELGKVVRKRLPGQQAEQVKILEESPQQVEGAVNELLQSDEFKAEIKSLLEELMQELAVEDSTTSTNLNLGANSSQINQPQASITINHYNSPPTD